MRNSDSITIWLRPTLGRSGFRRAAAEWRLINSPGREVCTASESSSTASMNTSTSWGSPPISQTAQPPLDRAVALAVALDALAGREGTGTELDAVLQRLRAELVRIGAGGPRS